MGGRATCTVAIAAATLRCSRQFRSYEIGWALPCRSHTLCAPGLRQASASCLLTSMFWARIVHACCTSSALAAPMAAPIGSLFVTLRRGFAGASAHQVSILKSLGFTYREQTLEMRNTAASRGAVDKVGERLERARARASPSSSCPTSTAPTLRTGQAHAGSGNRPAASAAAHSRKSRPPTAAACAGVAPGCIVQPGYAPSCLCLCRRHRVRPVVPLTVHCSFVCCYTFISLARGALRAAVAGVRI